MSVFDGETALEYNGDNSRLFCPAQPSTNITGAFSFESWIKPYTLGQSNNFGLGRIIDKEKISVYLVTSFSNYNDSSLIVELEHDDGTSATINSQQFSIQTHEWQHIAVTYDGVENIKIYLNGEEQNLNVIAPVSGPIKDNVNDDLIIGNSTSFPLGAFCGLIDEVRFWDCVLEQSMIVQSMNNYLHGYEYGLVAYYRMNDGNGNYATDMSVNANDAMLDNAIWCQGIHLDPPVSVKDNESTPYNRFNVSIYPNPFSDHTYIHYTLKNDAHVRIIIFDMSGKMVKYLVDSKQTKGEQKVKWNTIGAGGTKISNGIYLLKIEVNGSSVTRKIVLGK
jgi:hypothetical protein